MHLNYSGIRKSKISAGVAILSILSKTSKLSANDPKTKHIFPLPTLIAFKCGKNVGNFLVRSAFKSDNQPGTFKC